MKREEKLVKAVVDTDESLKKLTTDEISKTPDSEPEPQTQLTSKELAAEMGVKYIEPLRKMKPLGSLPEKLKKEHDYDWEYVKGIYENIESVGESIEFWHVKYPGDPDCLWDIPANTPVFVPRMIARHLEDIQKYHTFSHSQKPTSQLSVDGFMEEFEVTGTTYRGKFRPIEAFR